MLLRAAGATTWRPRSEIRGRWSVNGRASKYKDHNVTSMRFLPRIGNTSPQGFRGSDVLNSRSARKSARHGGDNNDSIR